MFRISGVILLIFLIHSCTKEKPTIPIITTADISDTTQTSAICGGNIKSDGGTTITARGVCWSTKVSPTTADNKTQDSIGPGSFTSNISGLNSGTTYYVRAYATNNAGTGYGSEKTFKTSLSQAQEEEEMIQSYLSNNPLLDFQLQSTGLYYLETFTGTGLAPAINDSVYVFYTGKLLDGIVFGSNATLREPYGFIINVGENIVGFDQGIMLMKEGGKATLLIPSSLGFGADGVYYISIPGYTPLLFDVELVRVIKR